MFLIRLSFFIDTFSKFDSDELILTILNFQVTEGVLTVGIVYESEQDAYDFHDEHAEEVGSMRFCSYNACPFLFKFSMHRMILLCTYLFGIDII